MTGTEEAHSGRPRSDEPKTEEPRRPGRPGRRRAVAPATSGQSEEVESRPYVPEVGDSASDQERTGGSFSESGSESGSKARDRWYREQRPPHW